MGKFTEITHAEKLSFKNKVTSSFSGLEKRFIRKVNETIFVYNLKLDFRALSGSWG